MTQMLAFSSNVLYFIIGDDVLLSCNTHSFVDDFVSIVDDEDTTLDKGKEVTAPHCCSTGNQTINHEHSFSLSQLRKLIETPDFSGSPGLQYQKLTRRHHSGKRCHHEVQHSQLRVRLCVRSELGRFGGCYSLSKQ